MSFLTWSQDRSIGIGEIGEQHTRLVDLINCLYGVLVLKRHTKRAAFSMN